MNYTQKLSKASIFIAGSAVAFYSASLTYSFMNGLSPTLGAVGVLMELIKFFSPMLALYAFRKGAKVRGLVLSLITLLLVATSFTASFVAVDNGFQSERKESEQFKSLTWQIATFKQQSESIRQQAALLPANYHLKRSELLNEAREVESQASALLDARATLKTDSIGDLFGRYIAIATALIIELLTVATTIALSLFDREHTRTQSKHTGGHRTVETPVLKVSEPSQPDTLTIAARDTHHDIKTAIVCGAVKPSHRGISAAFGGVGRDIINEVLQELFDGGILKPYRRGYALA